MTLFDFQADALEAVTHHSSGCTVNGPLMPAPAPFVNRFRLRVRPQGNGGVIHLQTKAHFSFVVDERGVFQATAFYTPNGIVRVTAPPGFGLSIGMFRLKARCSVGVFRNGARLLYERLPDKLIADVNVSTFFGVGAGPSTKVIGSQFGDHVISRIVDFAVRPSDTIGITASYRFEAIANPGSDFDFFNGAGVGLDIPLTTVIILS